MSLLIVLIAGAIVRVVFLSEVQSDVRAAYPDLDGLYHHYWARALATGDWVPPPGQPDPQIREHAFIKAPGYPYALSILYRLTGPRLAAARTVQTGLGLVSVALVYILALRMFDRRAAAISTVMYLLCWIFPYYESQLQETSLAVALWLALWVLLLSGGTERNSFLFLAAGLTSGALALVRPNILLLIPLLAVGIFWIQASSPVVRWRAAGLFLLGAMMAVLPVTVRNFRVSGDVVPITAGSGLNLYIGNNPIANGYTGIAPGIQSWSTFDLPRIVDQLSDEEGKKLTYAGASAVWKERALSYIRGHPGRTLSLMIQKSLLFWGPLEVSVDQVDELERNASPVLRLLLVRFPLILGLSFVGCVFWLLARVGERERRFGILVLAAVAVYSASFLPFTVTGRYRAQIIPLLLPWAAYSLVLLWNAGAGREYRRLAMVLMSILAVTALTSVNWAGYKPEKEKWHLSYALAHAKQSNWEAAEKSLRLSIEANPGFVRSWKYLASLLIAQERYDEAGEVVDRLMKMAPTDPDVWDRAGTLSSRLGLWEEASERFSRGLEYDARHVTLLINKGTSEAALGRIEEAIPYFEKVTKLAPHLPEGWFDLGRAYDQGGRPDDAVRAREKLLQMRRPSGRYDKW